MADKNNTGMNPIVAGVVGMGVGAAVGAAAVVLSDEEKRKDLIDAAGELKNQAMDSLHDAEATAKDATDDIKAKAVKKFKGATKGK